MNIKWWHVVIIVVVVIVACFCFTFSDFFKSRSPLNAPINNIEPTTSGPILVPTSQAPNTLAATKAPEAVNAPEPTATTPAPVYYVVLLQEAEQTSYPGFQTLTEVLAEEGISFSIVKTMAEFQNLANSDASLLIYPASMTFDRPKNFSAIDSYVSSGGHVLYIFNSMWRSFKYFAELGLTINGTETINKGGSYSLGNTLPDFLQDLDTLVTGSNIIGSGYIELDPEIEGGERVYIDEEKLVFYSLPDRSVTFMLQIRSSNPASAFFFDDVGIQNGDNSEAFVRLLKHLMGIPES